MKPRVHLHPRKIPRIHLLKQRLEPMWLLVINRNRLHAGDSAVRVCCFTHRFSLGRAKIERAAILSGPFEYIALEHHPTSRSGRFLRVFSTAAARRHFATSAWFPP